MRWHDDQPRRPPRRKHATYALAGVLALLSISVAMGEGGGAYASASERSARRVVHRFDFDERDQGNLEDLPKFWEPFRPPGFPHYAGGGFDFEVGHDAPPSFHLTSEGRNVAFHYLGPETRVQQNSEYRIEGWIRPDRLHHARACLSAHFVDRYGNILLDSIVRSAYIGDAPDGWQVVSLHLPPAPTEAFSVGITAWVVQRSVWDTSVRPAHHIPHRDVAGGAWFDDLTVYRLPKVAIESSDPANVLSEGAPQLLWVTLADHDDRSLIGTLSIRDADGLLIETHTFPVVLESDASPHRVPVEHLDPGLYHAELTVAARGQPFITRSLTFARLGPRLGPPEALARSFGISIDPSMRTDPDLEGSLLLRQSVNAVKFPVWTGRPEAPPNVSEQRKLDRMFQKLVQSNFAATAVLHGAPSAVVQAAGTYTPSLLDLLSTDPDAWEQHLATVAAPYAGTFRWWQIGPDGDRTVLTFERLGDVLENVRVALRPFITNPRLAAPADASITGSAAHPTLDQVTILLGPELPGNELATVIGDWRGAGSELVSVRVDPLDEAVYARRARLADWARRVILARHAGAPTVYVPQTWRVRETSLGRVTEPVESYVLLRTIADVIGDRQPGPELLRDGARLVTFRDADHSVLAAWSQSSGGQPVPLTLSLGSARRQMDLQGQTTPLPRNDAGFQRLTLTETPVFVDGIENWMVDLLASLTITPRQVESGTEKAPMTLEWVYRGSRSVAGRVELLVPDSWAIEPRELDLRLTPNRIERMNVVLRLPPTETAGGKAFVARVRLSDPPSELEIPVRFDLGLHGIDVWGTAYVDGDQLVMQHAMTNNSAETISFRSAANVPGRERQYRPFTDLKPGDTQTAIFRFDQGRDLVGRRVSMVLRELNDGRRTHTLELVIP